MVIKRVIATEIKKLAKKYPVIALTGPRQSGKTTLLKTLFPDYRYVSLESPDIRQFAETDTRSFLEEYNGKVIFDEAQRVPVLFSYLQTIVDESGKMGEYILSGSQNFHLMQNITQSLAGRVAIFRLFPFDFTELKSENLLAADYEHAIIEGFYPAIFDREIEPSTFYSNYIQTYVQRDVSELIAVRDLKQFQNFIALCAVRAGQLLNLNAIAVECGITQPTAKAWLTALETSYIIFLLQPYAENFSKRIIRTPKLFFYDTGLLAHLLKIKSAEALTDLSLKGNLFENMMVAEYVKRMNHTNKLKDLWFWRDASGYEIDLMIEDANMEIAEIKATKTIMPKLFKNLQYFEGLYSTKFKRKLTKSLVYGGDEAQKRTAGNVVPWSIFGDVQ